MNLELSRLLADGHGVVHRDAARNRAPDWAVGNAVAARELVRVLPRTYVAPGLQDDPPTLRRAALAYAGPCSALSHVTAVHLWLPALVGDELPVQVTVPAKIRLRATRDIVVHRRTAFVNAPPLARVRSGLAVVSIERAVLESWPLLDAERRVSVLVASVSDRRTTVRRLEAALTAMPTLADRASIAPVLALIRDGCHSWLEIYGCTEVFRDPALPASLAQVPVTLGRLTVYLDRFFDDEQVNVELDGAESHSSDQARERDRRRDAALATLGILVVRYTYKRLTQDLAGVRSELLDILAVRRRQLRVA